MSKILIISDIHVNDYPRYNYTPKFRLRQFDKLGDRIIEIANEQGCDTLFIAGDIIDHPIIHPRIIDTTKKMLNKFSARFKDVYYILGQHDLASKNANHESPDSLIHSIIPSNFHYMDKELLEIENRKIAFMDWRPTQDLTWLNERVDLFVGHVTISNLFGQEIDTSKFKLGICGDIHVHGKVGNLMKIGVPIQHSMSDQQEGTVVVYDTRTNKGEYVKTDPDHSRFLQIYYTENKELDGFSEDYLTYHIYRPKLSKGNKIASEVANPSEEIDKLIETEIKQNELEEIHNELKGIIKSVDNINFDFKLLHIHIENLRSIHEFDYDFDKNLVLTGLNGSGKSTFILAIYKALVGDRQLGQLISHGASTMKIQLSLEYEGNKYEITRGSTWGLRINDAPECEPYNNKGQFEADVKVKLPFLNYIDSFYFNYWNIELLGSMNNARRVELITKYNRLDILDSYNNAATERCTEIQLDINDCKKAISEQKVKITEGENNKQLLQSRIEELQNSLTTSYDECDSEVKKYDAYIKYKSETEGLNTKIQFNQGLIDAFNEDEFNLVNGQYKSWSDRVDRIDKQVLVTVQDEGKLNKLRDDLKRHRKDIAETQTEKDKVSTPGSYKCKHCGSTLTEETRLTYISNLDSKISKSQELLDSVTKQGLEIAGKYSKPIAEYSVKLKKVSQDTKTYLNKLRAVLESLIISRNNCERAKSDIVQLKEKLRLLGEPPEVSSLTNEEISKYRNELKIHNNIKELQLQLSKIDINAYQDELAKMEEELTKTQETLRRYILYRDITSRNGIIYRKFLLNLAERLSNERFKFNVVSQRSSGTEFFDVNIKYNVDNNFIEYKELSSGQKTLADLYFISRIINKGGILVLDEFLRFLDNNNHDDAIELIQETDVNQIILSTHNHNVFLKDSDRIEFVLNEGVTHAILT